MINVAVVYYSGPGNVHRLAPAAAEAAEKEGAEVLLRRAAEITTTSLAPTFEAWTKAWEEHTAVSRQVPEAAIDDLDWADVVLWGTPGRYGLVAAPLKHFIDQMKRPRVSPRSAGEPR